ncbi:MAG: hypothetical protein ACK4WH_00365 [Phycisphaerales bacterium]
MAWCVHLAAFAAATVLWGAVACGASPAATDAEVRQWAVYYWHLKDHGTPHPGAQAFEFSDPAMDQAGVHPFSGALPLFRKVYAEKFDAGSSSCHATDIFDLLEASPEIMLYC